MHVNQIEGTVSGTTYFKDGKKVITITVALPAIVYYPRGLSGLVMLIARLNFIKIAESVANAFRIQLTKYLNNVKMEPIAGDLTTEALEQLADTSEGDRIRLLSLDSAASPLQLGDHRQTGTR